MTAEFLPASGASGPDLVLLHGWGGDREIWRTLLCHLRPWANVTLLDIPGLAPSLPNVEPDLEAVLDELLAHCPSRAVYLGWSLGGQLALEIAHRHPDRVSAVATLCSNPRFVGGAGWPGMDPEVFTRFREAAQTTPAAVLRRFDALQVAGSAAPRALLRRLQGLRRAAGEAPLAGLEWLAALDQRAASRALGVPQLHLLAENDALVPAEIAETLDELLQDTDGARVETLPGISHLAPLEAAPAIAATLREAMRHWGLLQEIPALPPPLDKQDVAESFSRAAPRYDAVARLQREVGAALLERAVESGEPADVVDLGSGTGYFQPELARHFPRAVYTGLDLAEGMVRYARQRYPGPAGWVLADAESLPLAAASQDLVFSSLAIQWCPRPALLFAELARVLRPGGRCVFTTMGPGTLHELRAAWAAVDGYQHVNDFPAEGELLQAAARVPGVRLHLSTQLIRLEYERVLDLLLELKTLGAHNVNRQRPAGLTGRGPLQRMMDAYEARRVHGLLPATYEIIFGELEKLR